MAYHIVRPIQGFTKRGFFCLRRGFSLIEVVLALGIVSFALVGLLGMLPFGLDVFRRAIDQTVGTQITQEITGMIQRTPFASLPNLGSARTEDQIPGGKASFYYYDVEGTLLSAIPSDTGGGGGASAVKPLNPVYLVQVYAASDAETAALLGSSPASASPGTSSATAPWGSALSNIRAVHIDVRNLTMTAATGELKVVTYVANAGF